MEERQIVSNFGSVKESLLETDLASPSFKGL
jgi:hypothetical protein